MEFFSSFMKAGGPFMWVILIIWITGIGLSLYKVFFFQRVSVNANKFFDLVKGHVLQNEVEKALNLCAGSQALLPQILRAGLKRANEDRETIEDAITVSMMEHTPKLNYFLSYVSLIANASTLIGLLGTIQGLIGSFAAVGSSEITDKSAALADGIAKAMNTTALGLVSAITIMAFHTYLSAKAQKNHDKIEEFSGKLIDLLSIKRKKGTSEV
jgi:biopolymer transport protein ExbB/TolQ